MCRVVSRERTDGGAWWRGFVVVEAGVVGDGAEGRDDIREVRRARGVGSVGLSVPALCGSRGGYVFGML